MKKNLKSRLLSRLPRGGKRLVAVGLLLIVVSLASTVLIPFAGLADEWMIPLGVYLVKKGLEKKR